MGAETDFGAASEGVTKKPVVNAYSIVDSSAKEAEEAQGKHGARVVRVYCTDEKLPELWYGTYGNAPVESGANGYVLSDGTNVIL